MCGLLCVFEVSVLLDSLSELLCFSFFACESESSILKNTLYKPENTVGMDCEVAPPLPPRFLRDAGRPLAP